MAFFKFRLSSHKVSDDSLRGDEPAESVDTMRRRARQRLVGATILVVIAVAVFPLVFDTQPRPVALDLAISIPDPAKVMPETPVQPVPDPKTAPSNTASQPQPEPEPEPVPVAAPEPAPVPEAAPVPAAEKKAESKSGKYLVQVGAFAEESKVREVRSKLEKAGLKTIAVVLESKEGKKTRVRMGPFNSKADAEKAAEKAKSLQLPAILIPL
jgi:DedD protein